MYIDVRGPHPVLFNGMRSVVLHNEPRSIPVYDAISKLSEEDYWKLYAKPEPPPVLEDEPFQIRLANEHPDYKSLWMEPRW